MAAESDGGVDEMVSVEEQPIDLSKVTKKPMPPLIPISFLRSVAQEPSRQVPPLYPIKDNVLPRKRVREGSPRWDSPRLDRARSVPQLNPLTSTLQRNKSLSESRIPSAASAQSEGLNSQVNDELLQSSWIYIGYYSQLLHRFQAQEMLRQFALHSERDGQSDEQGPECTSGPPQGDQDAELKRRQTRPLTGKHVRTGTGASPATLLSLRRKIQARRQRQHDPQTSS